MNKKIAPIILIISSFIYISYISYLTPLHSDDYHYSKFGLDIQNHIHQYFNWSGRIVADYISPALLSIQYKPLLAIIQTIGFFALIFIVYKIPQNSPFIQREDQHSNKNYWVFLSILSLYILSSPSFGQTNLWVVGSANYMWTALLYIIYIYILLGFLKNTKINFFTYPLALAAGCTNEAAAAIISIASITLLIIYTIKTKKINISLSFYILSFILGSAILILAPGNEVRLDAGSYSEWNNYSILEKITHHFFGKKFLNTIASSVIVYLTLFFFIAYLIKTKINKKNIWINLKTYEKYAIFFFLMAIATNSIMAFSPVYPARSMTTSFLFCLISISFILNSSFFSEKMMKITSIILFSTTIICLISLTPRYESLHQQEIYIKEIAKNNTNNEKLTLPSYFQRWTPFKDFKIDGYYSTISMAKYYGVKNLNVIDPEFDYSILSKAPNLKIKYQNSEYDAYHYKYIDRLIFLKKIIINKKHKEFPKNITFTITYDNGENDIIRKYDEIPLEEGFIVFKTTSSPFNNISKIEISTQ